MMQQTWDSRSIDPRDRVETIRTMLCENLVQTDLTLDPQGREAHVNVSYQDIGQLRALSVKTVPSLAALAMRPQRMIMSDDDESLFVVFQRGNRSSSSRSRPRSGNHASAHRGKPGRRIPVAARTRCRRSSHASTHAVSSAVRR